MESAAGIGEGGRTGLVAAVVAGLFILASSAPLAAAVPTVATAPALIIVGSLMLRSALRIRWDDPTDAVPAFLTVIAMPLTFSIANGIALGFISYALDKVLAGRARQDDPLVYVLAGLILVRYA